MYFWKACFLTVLLGFVDRGSSEIDQKVPNCGDPELPLNGYVTVVNKTVGSMITVGCRPGYYTTGTPPFTRTCLNDGQWSHVNIQCKAKSCGDPGIPRHGRRLGLQFNYLNVVRFACNHGYILHGSSSRRCQANQTWSLTQPLCKPVSCGKPLKVHNAFFTVYGHSPGEFVYGNKVLYSCQPGFYTNKNGFISCEADAKWHGALPNCSEVNCPKLFSPANGELVTSSNNTKEGSRVRYHCHAGYMMFGPRERTCLNTGRWSGPGTICFKCSGVGTQVFVRKPRYFKHGKVLSKSGHTATVRYDDGQEEDVVLIGQGTKHYIIVEDRIPSKSEIFVGTRVLAFNSRRGEYVFGTVKYFKGNRFVVRYDGWSYEKSVVELHELRTLEPPRFCATCKDPGTPLHSSREDDVKEFIPGMEVIYTCQYTYKMIGTQRRTCLINGTWTGINVTCNPYSCDDLDAYPPRNGERFGNNFTIGNTLEFKCKEGYTLIGQKILKCLPTGKWSHSTPICQSVCANYRCALGEKCIYDNSTRARRRCVCSDNMDCPATYFPVCGSDGRSYNSPCIMAATACRTKKMIKAVQKGLCRPAGLCQIVPYSVCRGSFSRFFYNVTSKQCQPLIAGGCHPSGWNGFVTEMQCRNKCLVDVCQQSVDSGPCSNTNKRWSYDPLTGKCKSFNYGGCYGNENNFLSEDICLQRCLKSPDKGLECQQCKSELHKTCKRSSIAVLARVTTRLPNNGHLLRYVIDVDYVIKNTNHTIKQGTLIVSIPYQLSPGSPSKLCACPRIPIKKKFILIGQIISDLDQSKNGLVLNKNVFIAAWSPDVRRQVKLKCGDQVMIPRNIR